MPVAFSRALARDLAPEVRRQVDPRTSITGQLLAVGLALAGLVLLLLTGAVWWVTTRLAATTAQADAVFGGAVLLLGVFVTTEAFALAAVRQSIVGGLRTLDSRTQAVVERGRFDGEFEIDRDDEIGRLSWNVAELRNELDAQVDAVESLNRDLASVATSQSRTLAACERGDLTRRMDEDTDIPQFDAMALNFNSMMDRTERLVGEVRSFSRTVSEAATATADSVQSARTAAADIVASTESISDGVSEQHRRVDRTAAATGDLSASIEEIAGEADAVAKRSERAARTTREGGAAAEEALGELDAIREQTDRSVADVAALHEMMDDISETTDRIAEMAKRSNKIAINAQIESARSSGGDAAHIISSRIKKLADDTGDAADEIDGLVESLEAQTEAALAGIRETETAVERGAETIETAFDALEDVETAVEDTRVGVEEIDDATDRQADRAQEVAHAVEQVRQIGEATAEEAGEVAERTHEQRSAIDAVNRRIERLSAAADDLDERLDAFTVGQATDATRRRGAA
ncbi:Methyl-accepting chemotaxis protein [Natronoarchaeum philippinense]|uniref:Methyl-accepting chemotaxis protein n=1 Tax=Natronoarchaeum philippinense TaxID=558529 RepID=A0A285N1L3_NATPI|nr:methyl-accepting chemotaxis protein [Natronoarchaeum philippinense]SNZ03365.1 Methyl-accepting chemotaxis protein [Natronoarchaeum philippinense]